MLSNLRFSQSPNPAMWSRAAAVALAVAALAGCGGSKKQAARSASRPEASSYLQNIQIAPGRVEAAQNFLQHTVTTIYGTVTNNGNKTVRKLEISLTFSGFE